jgi:GGDEF domain-containing protein
VDAVQRLSLTRSVAGVQEVVRSAARTLVGSEGATFVLRDGECCYYADEDAIAPLWKGRRFPLTACISGWSMLNRQAVVIPDIYADKRIPHDAYRPTFVKSLVMVPIRSLDPIGAIGTYWATNHSASEAEVAVLRALADSTAVAMERAAVLDLMESDRAREEEFHRQAMTDELTGLANRRAFMLLAEHQVERLRRSGLSAAVLFIDMDGLKTVNDEHGHAAGDLALQRLAEVLKRALRAEDVVARLGGDEFAVMVAGPHVYPSEVVGRLRVAAGGSGGFSVGAALYRPRGDSRRSPGGSGRRHVHRQSGSQSRSQPTSHLVAACCWIQRATEAGSARSGAALLARLISTGHANDESAGRPTSHQ